MIRTNYDKRDLGKSFALAVAVMVVASLVLSFVFNVNSTGLEFWIMQAIYTALIGLSAVLYSLITKTKFVAATRLNKAPRLAHLLWGCGAVVFLIMCMMPINIALLDIIDMLLEKLKKALEGVIDLNLQTPSVDLDDNVWGLLIVACLLPCFTEEVVFRGTVAQSLASNKNKLGALAISGALFALFHANASQTIHQFILGCWLTLLVYRTNSLWSSIIVHFFNNALVVALNFTPLGNDEFWSFTTNPTPVTIMFLVGLAGFASCVFGYLKSTKSVWQNSDETPTAQQSMGAISTFLLVVSVVICSVLWFSSFLS